MNPVAGPGFDERVRPERRAGSVANAQNAVLVVVIIYFSLNLFYECMNFLTVIAPSLFRFSLPPVFSSSAKDNRGRRWSPCVLPLRRLPPRALWRH